MHHTFEGQGLGPSLARRVGVGPDVSDVILSCEFPHGGSPNAMNEPTTGSLSVGTCVVEAIDEADATNEPTEARKNETNEPKLAVKRKQPGGSKRNWTN